MILVLFIFGIHLCVCIYTSYSIIYTNTFEDTDFPLKPKGFSAFLQFIWGIVFLFIFFPASYVLFIGRFDHDDGGW